MRPFTSRCPLQRNYRLNNKKLVDNAGFERRDLYTFKQYHDKLPILTTCTALPS